jgi:two-component system LytT family response regulator
MIRAIIVDDEYLARQRVLTLLKSYEEIKVIGEAKNGEQAVEMINMKTPDLVFLDVQMPDFNGFDVIKKVNTEPKPYIIFTTAFDSYAIKAFNVHALDYLLKPFDEERFDESITKVKHYLELKKSADFNGKLVSLVKDFQQIESRYKTYFVIKDKGREVSVDLDDVLYLEANGNYINFCTLGKTHLYRSTMNTIADALNPEIFLRIHRSFIINKRYISQCQYLNNSEYEFLLKNGAKLISGRSFKEEVISYLSAI